MSTFRPRRVLVTGGAGFIGSAFVRRALARFDGLEKLVVLDALTYAGHQVNLADVAADPRYRFVRGDICDHALVAQLFADDDYDAVFHLAAESHVDRSIDAADVFVRTNVTGTFTLLDAARRAWGADAGASRRFVHVSTDEVYGALGPEGAFTEESPLSPTSPYAASKAASDLFVSSFFKTHGLPAVITNTCNNYGPRQLPEKLLPLMIVHAAEGRPLPVYGEGKQVREWIHADDHADGLCLAAERGVPGERYNFGSGDESSNLELVTRVADLVDAQLGRPAGTARAHITFVEDRKAHDFRYAVDCSKAKKELGFLSSRALVDELPRTVAWYLGNAEWRRAVATDEHARFQASHYAGRGGAGGAR
jgi:dTDP-glucose 4,6-dehydratase